MTRTKSEQARQKTKWLRCPEYLAWVRTLPCVISEGSYCVAHHLIGNGRCGTEKTHDFWAFPLTDVRHKELHQYGWPEWESNYGSQWGYVVDTLTTALVSGVISGTNWARPSGVTHNDREYCEWIVSLIDSGVLKLNKRIAQGRNNIL